MSFIKTVKRKVRAVRISASELLGIEFEEDVFSTGLRLGDANIDFYTYIENGSAEYIGVVRQPIGGKRLNQLLYEIAPNKRFGLDTDDVLDDWQTMLTARSDDSDYQGLLERHRGLGFAWELFEDQIRYFRSIIADAYMYGKKWSPDNSSRKRAVPVIRWVTSNSGKRAWIYDSLSESVKDSLGEQKDFYRDVAERHSPRRNRRRYPSMLNTLLGYFCVAYFSPEVRRNWPETRGYNKGDYGRQIMGVTQVPVLSLMMSDALSKSKFLAAAETYIKSTAT